MHMWEVTLLAVEEWGSTGTGLSAAFTMKVVSIS